MPFGDIGGTYSQLIITCMSDGNEIQKGDAVALIEDYIVTNKDGKFFGVALKDSYKEGEAIPVVVSGVMRIKTDIEGFHFKDWKSLIIENGKVFPSNQRGRLYTLLCDRGNEIDILV